MLKCVEITLEPRWWNFVLKSFLVLSNSVKSKICASPRKKNWSISRVPRNCNLRNSHKLGISICETMKPQLSNLLSSSRSNRSKSLSSMKNRSPNSSCWNKVIARVWLRCANKKRFSSAWRTTTRQMRCVLWLSSRKLMRLTWWMKIWRWPWCEKWKNLGKSINSLCKLFWSASRETVRNRSNTDKSTLKD